MAQLLSGMFLSRKIIKELKSDLLLRRRHMNALYSPCLAIIETGVTDKLNSFVRLCVDFAAEIGIVIHHYTFANTVTQTELLQQIYILNGTKEVSGIFVVVPIISINPIDVNLIMDAISIYKDVCGLHSINRCRLAYGDFSVFLPCTASACFELIKNSECRIDGAHVVIYGREMSIGSPLGDILKWYNATVTICHLKTRDIKKHTRSADILVVAVGSAEHLRGDAIKPGAVVIDCGNNLIQDERKPSGFRAVGDVAFDEAIEVAGYLTAIPSGITSLSIVVLLQNTIKAHFLKQ